jgi:hypothetical protein
LSRREEQINEFVFRRTIETRVGLTLPVVLTNFETTTEFGGGSANKVFTLAASGASSLDTGLVVLKSSIKNLGNGQEVKETLELGTAAWPTLIGTDLDPVHLVALPYTKKVVDAGTTGGITGSTYTEVSPLDKWRSVQIATTVPDDLSDLDRDYASVVNHAFPDTLLDASLDYAAASNSDGFIVDYGLSFNLIQGYRGACDAHIYEIYTNGPPSSLPTVTKFFPQEHRRTVEAFSASDNHLFARVWEFVFPNSLHDTITVSNTGGSMTIPATDPIALPTSGTEIVVDIQTERWKYGIYVSKIIKVLVP